MTIREWAIALDRLAHDEDPWSYDDGHDTVEEIEASVLNGNVECYADWLFDVIEYGDEELKVRAAKLVRAMTWKESYDDFDKEATRLEAKGYVYHHSAWAMGYISRKNPEAGMMEPYYGRFGYGWKLYKPSYRSTRYHEVSYFLKQRDC